MSITGSGTQADPYIVHSYSEIKTAINSAGQGTYIKLDNDINCNDYGVDFVWNSIAQNNTQSTYWYDLDLNGHTIKNFQLGANQYMFQVNNNPNARIHNGAIRNAFLNGGNGFLKSLSNVGGGVLESLSISVSALGFTGQVINISNIKNSAVYIEDASNQAIQNTKMTNSDIYIGYASINDFSFIKGSGDYSNDIIIDNCRIRGSIGSGTRGTFGAVCGGAINNSVIDIDWGNSTGGGSYKDIVSYGNATGVIANASILSNVKNMIRVTDEEIRNGDALRSAGFAVVNVVGD